MKFFAGTVAICLLASSVSALAQVSARGRIEPPRDPILETTAKHNLDVARWYLTKRKAYEGARDRLQEIMEAYPEFSRMDEVLFLMGEGHFKLDEPDKAVDFMDKLLKDYPGSEFAKKARERLDKAKGDKAAKG
jgi:outer membrane protein assembly factor BamD (BamD/ComL family)